MKIQCSNCGKKFDQEKYSNICPKCSTYNKSYDNYMGRELTSEEQAEYDAKYNREPMSYDRYPKDVPGADRLVPVWFKKTKLYKDRPYLAYVIPSVSLVILTAFLMYLALHI